MKTGITERLWQLGVGMLTGWVVLDLFLLAILKNGGRIENWHAVVWVAATFLGTLLTVGSRQPEEGGRKAGDGNQRTESGGRCTVRGSRWLIAGILTGVGVALPILFGWILSHFTDFSWDGMTSRGVTVRNLMNGQLAVSELTLGNVTAGFLAKLLGVWQAGKGINITMLWISACFGIGGLQNIKISRINKIIISLLAALNPVAIYQTSSYQTDGHVAAGFCCLCFALLKNIYETQKHTENLLAIVISFLALSATKKTGIFYGMFLLVIISVYHFHFTRKKIFKKNNLTKKLIAMVCLILLGAYVSSQISKVTWRDLARSRVFDIRASGYGVGNGGARILEYAYLPRVMLFSASAFSMTEGSPEKINLKPPFWTTRREIRIFEDLFPDPRAGGFGPFYSTALLLAGLGCLGLVAAGKWKYAPGWFLVLTSFGSSYFSQIWWARWTPQNWLLVVGMLMTLVAYGFGSSRVGALRGLRVEKLKGSEGEGLEGEEVQRLTGWKGTWVRTFAVLGMVAAFLNVGIIALYYGIGMVRQERILDSQMYVASQLPKPLPIYLQREDYVFIASKYWLEERGISTREVAQNVDKPRMKINRTHTRFPLPENWRSLLRRPEDEKVLRERGLVEE